MPVPHPIAVNKKRSQEEQKKKHLKAQEEFIAFLQSDTRAADAFIQSLRKEQK